MTIDEAIKILHPNTSYEALLGYNKKDAIKLVEEACILACECMEELKKWRTTVVNKNIKNDFANRSTLICHNCVHKDEYIEELEYELGK
jgi:hypothetical protein